MRTGKKRGNRELIGLGVLFVLFITALLAFERVSQQNVPHDVPSTLNSQSAGAKALYLLLQKEGFATDRMEAPWTALNSTVGLLVVIEPLRDDRQITAEELAALKSWIESGGSVLFMVTLPARPIDAKDQIAGDIAIVEGDKKAKDLPPFAPDSPYVRNVALLHVASPVRLKAGNNSHYQTLFRDAGGALAAEKAMGKGHVIVLANSVAASNSAIAQADNAILLYNIAAQTLQKSHRTIAFDEYHHGVGFESHGFGEEPQESMFASAPKPVRFVLLHLCALGALLIYVGNRRFGPMRSLHQTTYRASTDYVGSMARLFRRAHAGDIAIVTLYRQFVRDLRRQLDLTPDTPMAQLVARTVRVYGISEGPFLQFLTTCEEIDRGRRIAEPAMLQLARELDNYRRSCNLV
ncbi:MAG: hypothetical protein JWL77_644 [Chthonomonadaceae bacterium]|nr:hypothetical protein [Chthonomonadaceae bacterium]